MSESFLRHYTRDDGVTEVVVEIVVNNWGCAAQISGPAEGCYPAEGLECEIVKAWLDVTGMPPHPVDLTDAERERMEIAFAEDPPEAADGPDYDYD